METVFFYNLDSLLAAMGPINIYKVEESLYPNACDMCYKNFDSGEIRKLKHPNLKNCRFNGCVGCLQKHTYMVKLEDFDIDSEDDVHVRKSAYEQYIVKYKKAKAIMPE